MKRLSDKIAALVEQALADTEMPAVDRDDLEWEVMASVGQRGGIVWLVGVGLPVKLTGDRIMPFGVLSGPDDRGEIARTVKGLYEAAARDVAEMTAKVTSGSNGHSPHSSGPVHLILP